MTMLSPRQRSRLRASSWTDRVIAGDDVGRTSSQPAWLPAIYAAFESTVLSEGYPCYFGQNAVGTGDIYLTTTARGDLSQLPSSLAKFIDISRGLPRRRNNLAVFFEPSDEMPSHALFQQTCW